jgi:anaerobic selenocysteine-containing dehydrogenase
MNPGDAAARGLAEGDSALLSSAAGSVGARVRLDPALRDGVVAMTHGFGFGSNPGMPTAQAHPGVNVNELSAAGPGSFDPLSGMSQLTGIPVEVHAAG